MAREFRMAAMAVSVMLSSSCADLADIPRGTCGNSIQDPGEDCDRFGTEANTFCRPAGSAAGACRFDCTPGSAHVCPKGWACGQDAICRRAGGTFESRTAVNAGAGAIDLSVGDFDGDKRGDILVRTPADLRVFYSLTTGLSTPFSIPAVETQATVGQFTDDDLSDVAFRFQDGVMVWKGERDQTLRPLVYSTSSVGKGVAVPILVEGMRPSAGEPAADQRRFTGAEVLFALSGEGSSETAVVTTPAAMGVSGDRSLVPVAIFSKNLLQLARRPVTASLVNGNDCDQVAFAFQGDTEVGFVTPCRGREVNTTGPMHKDLPKVILPAGTNVGAGGVLAEDVNGDANVDLIIDGAEGKVLVAYGTGLGTFHSAPPAGVPIPDQRASATDPAVQLVRERPGFFSFPLAVGRITNDAELDAVTPRGIFLRTSGGPVVPKVVGQLPTPAYEPTGDVLWDEAIVADVNGDGFTDVVTASALGVEFFSGKGTLAMNRFNYTTDGPASNLSIGDLDGDSALDIVFRQTGVSGGRGTASVLFGRRFGVPAPPVSVGEFGSIDGILAAPLSEGSGGRSDGLADIVVVSRRTATENERFVSILRGAAERQLQAPFPLPRASERLTPLPVAFVGGQFSGTDPHMDLGIIALEGSIVRAWLAPLANDAAIDDATVTRTAEALDVPPGIGRPLAHQWPSARLAALDLDGQGPSTDEVAVLVGPRPEGREGLFQLLRAVGGTWTKISELPVGGINTRTSINWQLRAGDIDGDGSKDLVALIDTPAGPVVEAVRNPRSGSLDLRARVTLALPNGVVPTTLALANVDDDEDKEIVILTNLGAFRADFQRAEGTFAVAGPLTGLPAVDSGKSVVETCDVDADGIDDLVLLSGGSLQVFRGLAVNP